MMTGVGGGSLSYGSSYAGPGDVVSGASAWYGLRAYSAAKRGTNAITVQRPDTTQQDIVSLSVSGALDIATANTFAGTDATCTGTISGTTMSIASCSSGTLNVFDTLTGVGITQPSWISAIGTCASPPGTCTLNATQTVSVGETITAQKVLDVVRAYDQSGGNICSAAACNATTAAGTQAQLIPNCGNSLPCIHFQSNSTALTSGTATWPAQPITVSWVAQTIATTTSTLAIVGASGNDFESGMQSSSGIKAYIYTGGANIVAAAAPDNVSHAVQGVINTTTSLVNIDGTETSGTVGALTPSGGVIWGQNFAGSQFHGFVMEMGIWGSAVSSGNRALLCHNQFLYWATSVSC